MTYNLIHEPWIPVLFKGRQENVSLFELFSRAEEIQEISCSTPLAEPALYQFLHLLMSDCFAPESTEELVELLEVGNFRDTPMMQYLQSCEPYFDLFDKDRPFLQNKSLLSDPKLKDKLQGANALFHGMASGIGANVHTDFYDDTCAFSPAVVARGLLVALTISNPLGGGYTCAPTGGSGWVHVIRGKNLFETLVLNTLCFSGHKNRAVVGEPLWKCERPSHIPPVKRQTTTYREGLLAPIQNLYLIPEEAGPGEVCKFSGEPSPILIRSIYRAKGIGFTKDGDSAADLAKVVAMRLNLITPNMARCVILKDDKPISVRPTAMSVNSDVFRDLQPLLYTQTYDTKSGKAAALAAQGSTKKKNPEKGLQYRYYQRAPILSQWSALCQDEGWRKETELDLYGFDFENSKNIFFTRHRLRGVDVLFQNPDVPDPRLIRTRVANYVRETSRAISHLGLCLHKADVTNIQQVLKNKPGLRFLRGVGLTLSAKLWDHDVPRLCNEIPDEDHEKFIQTWKQDTIRYLMEQYDRQAEQLSRRGENLIRIEMHRQYLFNGLNKIYNIERKDSKNGRKNHEAPVRATV